MKRLKTLLLAIILFVGGTSLATAQAKVAHVNTQEILGTFSEFLTAQEQAKKLGESMRKTDEVQFNDMVKSLEETAARYQQEAGTQTKEVNDRRVQEVEQMRASIAEFQQQSQTKIQQAQMEKMQPIQKKVMDAINKVATTLGFQYVLDRASLVVANGTDITAEVKKELGY
ncbi:MAG: OmpH family outer membrane protein [Winogradskyella sp.]|uniref:OmpH family outer membrane protein n=1 Tax=Winogradskyella sp. TaxID=1883156 RepID=UPI0018322AAF|nr:OmpH family outer membrane protein [Winogradskyella sp.]MBT8245013.1 OmpH family outer membrane protein [Winogradskyella sp.]NNK22145.1 OmpH family outer membrane protein [Winogradskyella sp.]